MWSAVLRTSLHRIVVDLMRPWRMSSVVRPRSSALRWSAGRLSFLSLLPWPTNGTCKAQVAPWGGKLWGVQGRGLTDHRDAAARRARSDGPRAQRRRERNEGAGQRDAHREHNELEHGHAWHALSDCGAPPRGLRFFQTQADAHCPGDVSYIHTHTGKCTHTHTDKISKISGGENRVKYPAH